MSSKGLVKCFLRSLNSSHPDIPLLNQVEVIIGRSPQTKIKDPRLLSVKSNFHIVSFNVAGAVEISLDWFLIVMSSMLKLRSMD